MDKLQMVEELIRKTGVTYSEANDALENSGWNMLDAIVYLEKQGKTTGSVKFGKMKRTIGEKLKNAWHFCCSHEFEVFSGNDRVMNIPLVAAMIITLFLFEIVLPVAVIALLCGCSFRIAQRGSDIVNSGSCGFNISSSDDSVNLNK